ncbi:MAG: hypothetical protein ABL901_20160 [Hyphomicrobiaceae bacterium]
MLPQTNFKNQVNAAGGLVFLVVGGYLAWDATRSQEVAPCSARLGVPTQMSFQKADGSVLSPAEFQARVGISERGLIEKTSIKRVVGDKPLVLDIALGGPSADDTGAGFSWSLPGVSKARSACLSYHVFVPADFAYADGGTLPSLFGQANGPAGDGVPTGVVAGLTWSDQGQVNLNVRYTGLPSPVEAYRPVRWPANATLPLGRWVRIEQEAVLNTPSLPDGIARVWIDGRLALENSGIVWRGFAGVQWAGTLADVSYVPPLHTTTRKHTVLQLTPPQMSWQN